MKDMGALVKAFIIHGVLDLLEAEPSDSWRVSSQEKHLKEGGVQDEAVTVGRYGVSEV